MKNSINHRIPLLTIINIARAVLVFITILWTISLGSVFVAIAESGEPLGQTWQKIAISILTATAPALGYIALTRWSQKMSNSGASDRNEIHRDSKIPILFFNQSRFSIIWKSIFATSTVTIAIISLIATTELYQLNRLDGLYVPQQGFESKKHFLLQGTKKYSSSILVDGHGEHIAPPHLTKDEIIQSIKSLYPSENLDGRIHFPTTPDDNAYYDYEIKPHWPSAAYFYVIIFLLLFNFVHMLLKSKSSRFALKGRLGDIIALIQILALDKYSHRSNIGLEKSLQGPPKSARSWVEIATEHAEFFRVKDSGENVVSLISRHVSSPTGEERRKIDADYLSTLLKLAVELHDREASRASRWNVWIPVISALIAGVFVMASTK